jgi:hypothetical protein
MWKTGIKTKKDWGGESMVQVVECLLSKLKANSQYQKEKEKKKKRVDW